MSKADKMFEELGYEIIANNRQAFIVRKYYTCIEIDLENNKITCYDENDGFFDYFDIQELKAINEKCKELKWLDEK